MKDFIIFTDSCADIPQDMVDELDVKVIPMHFTIGGKTYLNYSDNHEMDPHVFYNKLRSGEQSSTSQINPDEFVKYWEPVLSGGSDILYISFSSGLSGTYQNSLIAKGMLAESHPERRVECFDSLCASFGEGLLVWYAANLMKSGKAMDDIISWLTEHRLNLCHWFTVDDLGHLKRGGRVSAATALVGTMLGIKPVLHVDDEGHLINMSKVRGRKQSLDAIVNKAVETIINGSQQTVFVSHGDCPDEAEYVAQKLREKIGVADIKTAYIGPVIGAHSGPGTMAVFFIGKER